MTPQVSNITYTDNGDPIYGGSIGINRFIDLLVTRMKTDKEPFFEAAVINFYTMLRNCHDKDPKVVERNIEQELIHLGVYITDYFNQVLGAQARYKIPIIIYFPSYTQIQAPVVRELKAEMQRLLSLAPRIKAIMLKSLKGQDSLDMGNVVFYFKEVGNRHRLPADELDTLLQRLTLDKSTFFRTRSPYLLLSHIAVDWHLVHKFSNMLLLESYTGKIIPPGSLGDKLVKSKSSMNVPFTVMIHRVFGDDTLIKPLVTHKRKKLMLVAAEKWKRRPTSMIVSDIAKISDHPESYIRSLTL